MTFCERHKCHKLSHIECDWYRGFFCSCLESGSKSFMMTLKVVPSKIPDQVRKRVQCQDSWGCPSEMKHRTQDIWGTYEKSSLEALGLWHLLHFKVLFYILRGVPSEIQTEKVNVDFYQGFKSVTNFVKLWDILWHFCDISECHKVTFLSFLTIIGFCHTVRIFLSFFSKT